MAVRRILVIAFIVGLFRIFLEFLKFLPNFQNIAFAYDLTTNISEQAFVTLLAMTSIGIYLDSTEGGIRVLLGKMWKHKGLSSIVLSIVIYSAFVSSYIAIERPYTVMAAKNLLGAMITTEFFPQTFLILISPNVFVLIIGVPAFLFLASRKTQNKQLSRNLVYLGLSSLLVGLGFLGFTIYQNEARVDSEGLLFFLLSIMFSSAAVSFNRASTYAGFLSNPTKPAVDERESIQFSKSLKRTHAEIIGSQFLVEVDVNAPYEETVIDFCLEFLSNGERVFVATPKSSVLHRALANYSGIRFCLFSNSVSRPTPVEKEEGQILIPQDSLTDIIDVLEMVWKQSKDNRNSALVLDNLSDRVMSIGLERTYKYLKEMLSILGERKVTCFFLVHGGTLDAQALNLLRSLFTHILVVSKDRLIILKE